MSESEPEAKFVNYKIRSQIGAYVGGPLSAIGFYMIVGEPDSFLHNDYFQASAIALLFVGVVLMYYGFVNWVRFLRLAKKDSDSEDLQPKGNTAKNLEDLS